MTVDAAVSAENLTIPLIDFGRFLNGTEEEQLDIGRQVTDGFQTAGFIYLKNHGVPADTIKEVFSQSAAFFARPQEQKNELSWYSPRANKGYSSPGREKVTQITDPSRILSLRTSLPDLKESHEIGRDDPSLPNMWPDRFDTLTDASGAIFRIVMTSFFERLKLMHRDVMRCIALGLNLPKTYFDDKIKEGDNNLRLLHYPASDGENAVKGERAGAHTDYGSVTLLFQDDVGGLQVRSTKGEWVEARPMEGTIVVNAGDLLNRWSNGKIKSTEHRVVAAPGGRERYSCVYFCNPDNGTLIEALPGTWEKEEDKKWAPVKADEYLAKRLSETYA